MIRGLIALCLVAAGKQYQRLLIVYHDSRGIDKNAYFDLDNLFMFTLSSSSLLG